MQWDNNMFNIFKKNIKEDVLDRHAEACNRLVSSDAWEPIEQMFIDKIMDIQSVLNVDESSEQKALLDIKVRGLLARELKDIVLNIKGLSEKFEMNIQQNKSVQNDDYVTRFDI